jgi:hypothetical protein
MIAAMRSRFRRALALTAGAVALALLAAPAALAHVTVASTDAEQGGFAVLTFRVPAESETASTTKLTVGLPTDHPLAFVSVEPHPGWSYTIKQTKSPALLTQCRRIVVSVVVARSADSVTTKSRSQLPAAGSKAVPS